MERNMRWTTEIEPGFVTDMHGYRICDYKPWAHEKESADARGRLIAAAPRVADALRALLVEAESLHEAYNDKRERDGWDSEDEDDSLSEARAALAEALGLTPNAEFTGAGTASAGLPS